MSIFALFMALLVFSSHACNARHSSAFFSNSKDSETPKLHETDIKVFPVFDRKETLLGGKTQSVFTLDESHRAMEMKGLMGKVRVMLESTSNMKPAHSDEDEPVEDVVVTDYVRRHPKSPIHNHH